ncbi:MAG: hypothetical protein H6562_25275 [Lewinellaceae bacterium]|nr:hypothetical protein [Lewinella sp.]MCB9282226.1 hypothetical protein [Lewinellaceae bacterium]
MKKQIFFMTGAALFLAAQIVLPQGTPDPAARLAEMQQNPGTWQLGHGLILLAVPLITLGIVRLQELGRLVRPWTATTGLVLVLFGLMSETAITALQMLSAGIAGSLDEAAAVQALSAGMGAREVRIWIFMPFLLLLPGSLLLALPLLRVKGYRNLAAGIALFGVLIVIGGFMQSKWAFVGAAGVLTYVLWLIPTEKPVIPVG